MTVSCPECGKRIIARSLKQAYRLMKRECLCERCQQEQNIW